MSERDIETCRRFVLVERERDVTFGKVPDNPLAPDTVEGRYVGNVIALRADTVFQDAGDGVIIAHPRGHGSFGRSWRWIARERRLREW